MVGLRSICGLNDPYVPLPVADVQKLVAELAARVVTMLSLGISLCLLGVLGDLYRALFLAPPTAGQELRLVTHH
jgi:hypothetical protein